MTPARQQSLEQQRSAAEAAEHKRLRELEAAARVKATLGTPEVAAFFETYPGKLMEAARKALLMRDFEAAEIAARQLEAVEAFRQTLESFIATGKSAELELVQVRARLAEAKQKLRQVA